MQIFKKFNYLIYYGYLINAILYSIKKEETHYLIDCEYVDIISWGKTKEKAIADLEKTIKKFFNDERPEVKGLLDIKDKSFEVKKLFAEVILNPGKHKPIVREVQGCTTIHIYDMVEETRGNFQRNYKMV